MTPSDVMFIDEPCLPIKRGDLLQVARFPKPAKVQWMPGGTKFTEYRGGAVLIQTPFRKDGWLSKALEESK